MATDKPWEMTDSSADRSIRLAVRMMQTAFLPILDSVLCGKRVEARVFDRGDTLETIVSEHGDGDTPPESSSPAEIVEECVMEVESTGACLVSSFQIVSAAACIQAPDGELPSVDEAKTALDGQGSEWPTGPGEKVAVWWCFVLPGGIAFFALGEGVFRGVGLDIKKKWAVFAVDRSSVKEIEYDTADRSLAAMFIADKPEFVDLELSGDDSERGQSTFMGPSMN